MTPEEWAELDALRATQREHFAMNELALLRKQYGAPVPSAPPLDSTPRTVAPLSPEATD